MGKPDEFPQDVWDAAMDAAAGLRNAVVWQSNSANEIIATCLASTVLAERDRCLLAVAEQRCERGTSWDLALVTAMNAIKPGSAVWEKRP